MADFEDQLEFLADHYTAKHGLMRAAIEWDDEELQELEPPLRRHIRHRLAERREAEEKVLYLRDLLRYYREGATDG